MASKSARERYAKKNETEELKRAFGLIDTKGDGKVDAEEVAALFRRLGHRARKREIEDMIWEVDEDCDKARERGGERGGGGRGGEGERERTGVGGCRARTRPASAKTPSPPLALLLQAVGWDEFQAMYRRCRADKTGFEPRRLYHVVEASRRVRDTRVLTHPFCTIPSIPSIPSISPIPSIPSIPSIHIICPIRTIHPAHPPTPPAIAPVPHERQGRFRQGVGRGGHADSVSPLRPAAA